ncbi:MAG: hypothetical protein QM739_02060 [Propionivibrio sp.]
MIQAIHHPLVCHWRYVAFLDIALGITTPLAGTLAGTQGIASVYLAGAIAVALSLVVALVLLVTAPPRR